MKVLMFGWEFPPHISGGLGTACYGITKGLYQIGGVEVLFVVPKLFGDEEINGYKLISAEEITINFKIFDFGAFLKFMPVIQIKSSLMPYSTIEEYYSIINNLKEKTPDIYYSSVSEKFKFRGGYGENLFQEIINYSIVSINLAKSLDFDIIHAHDWLTFPAGIAAKKISGKPLVLHVHATEFDRSGGNINPDVFNIEKNCMEEANKIITVSNFTRNILIEKYKIDPQKIVTVHNAVEPLNLSIESKLNKPVKEKIVTFLGRITLQKGPEYFVEAAYLVLQKTKNVRFVMAGSGDMMQKMVSRVAALGIGDRFHFTGFLKGDDVYKMYKISDVYVMPSISEPFGIAPLEAIQSNVPVIISKQSGVSEVLKYAIKVDFWDTHAIADAIYALINYDGLPQVFKNHGKEEVENLKWEDTARKIKNIYDELLN